MTSQISKLIRSSTSSYYLQNGDTQTATMTSRVREITAGSHGAHCVTSQGCLK